MGRYINPLRRRLSRASSSSSESDTDDEETKAAEFAANERAVIRGRFVRNRGIQREAEEQMRRLRSVREEREARATMEAEMEEIKRRLTEMDTIDNAYSSRQLEAEEIAEREAAAMADALDAQIGDDDKAYVLLHLWSEYESSWLTLEKRIAETLTNRCDETMFIHAHDIPWPPDEESMLAQMAAMEQWNDTKTTALAAYKRAFRKASLRWHPDKFAAKFGKYLDPKDADQVQERVRGVSQAINDAWSEINRYQP